MNDTASLLGRILLAAIFIMSGAQKFMGAAGTVEYMKTAAYPIPMPELTVWGVAALELFGGLAILLGIGTRTAAFALALFTIAAGALFHFKPDDQMQMIMLMKNLAIAGGLFVLAAHGAGRLALRG
jgi:putative oxidoreductase